MKKQKKPFFLYAIKYSLIVILLGVIAGFHQRYNFNLPITLPIYSFYPILFAALVGTAVAAYRTFKLKKAPAPFLTKFYLALTIVIMGGVAAITTQSIVLKKEKNTFAQGLAKLNVKGECAEVTEEQLSKEYGKPFYLELIEQKNCGLTFLDRSVPGLSAPCFYKAQITGKGPVATDKFCD